MGRPITAIIHRGPDCAFCRSSELDGKRYVCKRALPMQAATCADYRDSRKPSTIPLDALNTRGQG